MHITGVPYSKNKCVCGPNEMSKTVKSSDELYLKNIFLTTKFKYNIFHLNSRGSHILF